VLLKVDHAVRSSVRSTTRTVGADRAGLQRDHGTDGRLAGPKVYVESDICWTPDVIELLLEDLAIVPAVAPLSMKGDRFYDTSASGGATVNASRAIPVPPTVTNVRTASPIGSAGSCIVMREPWRRLLDSGQRLRRRLGREINHVASSGLIPE